MKVIIAFCVVLIAIGFYGCRQIWVPKYKGPVSDHFDGKRFKNITSNYEAKGFKDVIKWQRTRGKIAPWPQQENEGSGQIPKFISKSEVYYTFINHSSVLIQIGGMNILCDPVFSERASPFQFMGPKRARKVAVELDSLPPIDVVLISHDHYDHLDLATLKNLKEKFNPTFVVGLGVKGYLKKFGFEQVEEMDWWQQQPFKDLNIIFLPAQHWSNRGIQPFSTLWGSYIIEYDDYQVFFCGDAGYSELFTMIEQRYGAMDLAFIPIGAYEPRWFMRDQHMNPDDAVKAHKDLKSKKSVGIHFGTFQLTDEPINQPITDLKAALELHQVPLSHFIVPKHGICVKVTDLNQ